MNKTWVIVNFLIFLFFVIFFASIQSSLFHWILGWRPTFQIGFVFVVYVILSRPAFEGFLFTVLSCYCMGLLSVMWVSLNIFCGLCVFLALRMVRTRVYSADPVYFTWTSLAAIFGFYIVSWVTSLFEVKPTTPRPLDWLLEILLTSLFVRLVYSFCIWIDKKTKRQTLTELNS